MRTTFTIICLGLLFSIISCEQASQTHSTAFYYWRTAFSLTPEERNTLQLLDVKNLYVRVFDVKWDANQQAAIPVATIQWQDSPPPNVQVIPTVYITNQSLLELPLESMPSLAQKIIDKIRSLTNELQNTQQIQELQLDCDWSDQSREKFFLLVDEIRKYINEDDFRLSATIRLHQVKYFQRTGVPKVDEGVLMFYNMGDLNDPSTRNSILDLSTAKAYLENFDQYPLPLDLALPIYSWGVVMRDSQTIKLMNNVWMEDFEDSERFQQLDDHLIKVLQSTYINGEYVYKGDLVRIESPSQDQLEESIELLSSLLTKKDWQIIYYHLESRNLAHHRWLIE